MYDYNIKSIYFNIFSVNFQNKAKSERTASKKPTATTANTTKPPPLEEPGIQEVSTDKQIFKKCISYIIEGSKQK